MFVAGFLFVLGGVAALALLAFLFLTELGRTIFALAAVLALVAGFGFVVLFGGPIVQSLLFNESMRDITHWLGGALLVGLLIWAVWTEISGRLEAKRRGVSYAVYIGQKYPDALKYTPPRPWGPKLPH
jgi:hypothetical protein